VDSLQIRDEPRWDDVLIRFPEVFHEPFYKNYLETGLEDILKSAGFAKVDSRNCHVSKMVWGV